MKKSLSSGIVLVLCILLSSCVKEFSFSPQTVISVEDPQQRAVAEWFAWHFACPGGFVPIVQVGASDADVAQAAKVYAALAKQLRPMEKLRWRWTRIRRGMGSVEQIP